MIAHGRHLTQRHRLIAIKHMFQMMQGGYVKLVSQSSQPIIPYTALQDISMLFL